VVLPDETFEEVYRVPFGDMEIQALHLGPSHSPGDIVVWMPEQSLVIAGDIAFHERMLPIFEDTITIDWLETWEEEFEKLNGHLCHSRPWAPNKYGPSAQIHP